jgi:hypothetical protein
VLAIAAVGVTGCGTGQKAAATDDAPATTAPEVIDPEVTDPDVPEGFPEEGIPEDTEPESINGKVGDVATLVSTDTGEEILEVAGLQGALTLGVRVASRVPGGPRRANRSWRPGYTLDSTRPTQHQATDRLAGWA